VLDSELVIPRVCGLKLILYFSLYISVEIPVITSRLATQ
jgi:hypothetical protein